MTFSIRQDTKANLYEGIETLVIPIHHPSDLNRLALETQRGVYSVVEWLLTELGRSSELERCCGLSVSPVDSSTVVVNLELKQPGKQFEVWMGAGHNRFTTEGETLVICDRARRLNEKFSEKYVPFWVHQSLRK